MVVNVCSHVVKGKVTESAGAVSAGFDGMVDLTDKGGCFGFKTCSLLTLWAGVTSLTVFAVSDENGEPFEVEVGRIMSLIASHTFAERCHCLISREDDFLDVEAISNVTMRASVENSTEVTLN